MARELISGKADEIVAAFTKIAEAAHIALVTGIANIPPSYFYEERDQTVYHLCDLPLHRHHIPHNFETCYDRGAWTWESRYSY